MPEEIPAYKVLIAGTIVFVVGLFVFSVIFQAFVVFQEFQAQLVAADEAMADDPTILLLSLIPWGLGLFYISLIGTIIYFMIKGSGREKAPPIYWR